MKNTVVIVYAEGKSCALINGKFFGKRTGRIAFEHVASETATIDLGPIDLINGVGTMEEFQRTVRNMGFDISPVDKLQTDIFGEKYHATTRELARIVKEAKPIKV